MALRRWQDDTLFAAEVLPDETATTLYGLLQQWQCRPSLPPSPLTPIRLSVMAASRHHLPIALMLSLELVEFRIDRRSSGFS